ncbi:MAG: membrane-bound PQQ-dependent dehydrogenase, glucose/quinate/shikimate family [Georgfuchsia sp.]
MNSVAPAMKHNTFGLRLIAVLFIAIGAALALPGAQLAMLGGSLYYTLAGAGLLVSGGLLWRGRASGAWLYLVLLVGTLSWALWEAGLDGWALFPRIGLFLLLGLGLLACRRSFPAVAVVLAPVVILALTGSAALLLQNLINENYSAPSPADSAPALAAAPGDGEWPYIGGTADAQRFSPLQQITPANVAQLEVVWKVHLGMPPPGVLGVLEVTPLKIRDTLYMCNSMNSVIALDAETGETRWRFDPKTDSEGLKASVCRGVAYYRVPNADGLCSERIISFAKEPARIFAFDAHTGQRCPGFGSNGEVSLLEGMGKVEKGYYYPTSEPVIVRGKIVVGGSVMDGQKIGEPSGVIRGFDAVTGRFAWAWDMGRPGAHGLPPPGTSYTPGTPNSWAPMTGDEELGLVYVPLGNATPDYLSSHRTPEENKYASSIVAIDAGTGELRWAFQTVHKDVWDYDIPAPPTLVDFPTAEGVRPALIQTTKTGQVFVLDRRTGATLVQVEERPVSTKALPGEVRSPTQPYSTGMPSFSAPLRESDMWGITPFDQLWCRVKFREANYAGDFTPITDKPTIVNPGYLGGSNWYGVSVDRERQLLVLNVNHMPMYDQLIPRAESDRLGIKPFRAGSGTPPNYGHWPQGGLTHSAKTVFFGSPLGIPCTKPPFSEIAAVDLKTRKTVWRQPLGTARDIGPLGIPTMLPIRMGVPALGGPLLTRSGLIFIAATQEKAIRAFDIRTGKKLWQDRLPAGGHANPMTYYSEKSGRQFVVIAVSGHLMMHSGTGDYLIAYGLRKK